MTLFSLGIDSNDKLSWLDFKFIKHFNPFKKLYNDSFWATFNNGCIF
jgi:hypothetical protein